MKKFYLLSLLLLVVNFSFAQTSTVTIYASAITGAFITGNSTSSVRTDGNIVANGTGTATRGYAVFNLAAAGIPAGSVIGSVTAGIYINTYVAGTTATCNTNIYPGDLSGVTTPATLFNDMTTPAATNVSAVTYGAVTGNHVIASTAAAVTMVQAGLSGSISYCYTNTGSAVYTITGETGVTTSTTAVGHAPYLTIVYCPPPTAVSATATPTTICSGDTLTLTGAATGASGGYTWAGPGGYSAGVISTTMDAPVTGVYTFTATRSCTTYSATATAYSAPVTVNPLPAAVSGAAAVCTGGTTTLLDASTPGTWASNSTGIVTIDPSSGLVTGVATGSSIITYRLTATGCYITYPIADNNAPAGISGPTSVCPGTTMDLTDASPGGAWTSTAGTGSAGVVGGTVTGTTAGAATISYTIAGCPPATYPITINPAAGPITGIAKACVGLTSTLTDAGGTWSTSNIGVANVGVGTGVVTGVGAGTCTITYTLGTGCEATVTFTVNANPAAITGLNKVCPAGHGATIGLNDATGGGFWLSGNTAVGTVTSTTGFVTGISAGTVTITYKIFSSGCYAVYPVTVYPTPSPITGVTTFCDSTTSTLADADGPGFWSSSLSLVASVGASSGVVTGNSPGLATIKYTESDNCYSQTNVDILAAPVATITASGPTTFCTGGSVTLTTGAGGIDYQWFNGGSPISGATTDAYLVGLTGAYSVEITNGNNCSTTSAATYVTDGLTPVVTSSNPSATFCEGNYTILTANAGLVSGAISYQWAKNGAAISSATAPTYYVNSTGDYTCSVTIAGSSGACVASTPSYDVNVIATPAPSINFNGVSFVTGTGFTTYQWYLNTIAIAGATAYSWTPVENGSYDVVVSDAEGCTGFSSSILYTGFVNGVASVNNPSIDVYPNPASSVLHISSPATLHAVVTGVEGKVYLDVSGVSDINMTGLANGLYILMLYDNNGDRVMVKKIVKE